MGSEGGSNPERQTGSDPSNCSNVPANPVARRRRGVWKALFASEIGLLFLCYILGAATIFFQLPPTEYLSKGFMGARALSQSYGRGANSSNEQTVPISTDNIDRPGKTYDGYTLYASDTYSPWRGSTCVSLIDMERRDLHQWSIPFSKVWSNPPHIAGSLIRDSNVCIFACYLYENGDLLVVFHSSDEMTHGYGLAKLDKYSRVLWRYAANVHHDVVVDEDGIIYALAQRNLNECPKGLENVPPPWLVDYLVMLSPDGKEVREPISILEALRDSPYSLLLTPLETPMMPHQATVQNDESVCELLANQNVLHTNSVNVLTRAAVSKFPNLKEGQVLVSMRNIHALAVIDPATASVVWGTSGPWRYQHDAQFLESGHLMLFDNLGSPHGSRVLEYDPMNGSFPWSYPGVEDSPFLSRVRGMAQRLPNGNTLINISESSKGGKIIEVTPGREVVWSCAIPGFITTARRYSPDKLHFLKPGQRPRG
jgi:hypothetical protein